MTRPTCHTNQEDDIQYEEIFLFEQSATMQLFLHREKRKVVPRHQCIPSVVPSEQDKKVFDRHHTQDDRTLRVLCFGIQPKYMFYRYTVQKQEEVMKK